MATIKLVAGAQDAFASLMTTELNSLASGNAIIGSTAIDNSTNKDLFAEFSFKGGGSITPTGSPYLALYIYPLNGDGSTYGDGRFGSAAAGPPPANYYKGFLGLDTGAGTKSGNFAIPGNGPFRILLPRGSWKPVFYNVSGVTLSATSNILYYKTSNLSVA